MKKIKKKHSFQFRQEDEKKNCKIKFRRVTIVKKKKKKNTVNKESSRSQMVSAKPQTVGIAGVTWPVFFFFSK
jgi:hypothetical protein